MNTNVTRAEKCQNMADVRSGVDAIDRALVDLMAERFGYMDAAARIKNDRSAVRDDVRKGDVIAKVSTRAAAAGVPEHVAASIWEILVEGSIAYELEQWDKKRA